jgi:DNA-binding transcriptional LysR family regulator
VIPSPSELHYFVEVASTLNISRAAERLGISQPSLSLAVKRLEDSLGVELLIRSKSGVNLTRAGQRFVAQARLLLHEWERLSSEVQREETQLSGRYVIGAHPSVALFALPTVVPAIMRDHPEVELKIVHGLSRQITDEVIGFKVDFGIVVNPVEHPDLVIKTLAKDEVELWAVEGGEAVEQAKAGHGVLICDPDLLQTQSILKQLAKKGFTFSRTLTSSNLEVIAALTAAGAGVGILPGRVACREPSLGLEPLRGTPRFQDRICIVYRADAQRTAASKLLLSQLAKCLAG